MSLTLSLNTALTSLQTNQADLQLVSSNIANAGTEGYTRKTAQRAAIILEGLGAGVELSQVRRTVDQTLIGEMRDTLSLLSLDRSQQPYFEQMQDLFGKPGDDTSIGATITTLATALEGLATTPEGQTQRVQVINAAQDLARQFNTMSGEIQRLRGDAERQLSGTVDQVNANLQQIADLNDEIVVLKSAGQTTAELEDKRDQALTDLAGFLDIQTFTRGTGEVVVFTTEGTLLDRLPNFLSHNGLQLLQPNATHANGDIDGISLNNRDITTTLKGGELKGLIEMRDTVLPNLQAEIDQLAARLRDEVNALHNKGSGFPPPSQLSSGRLFDSTTDVVTVSGSIRFAVVESDGDVPENLATGQPFTVDLGAIAVPATIQDVVNAINTQAASQPPQVIQAQLVSVGSQFQLQVSTLNANHRLVLDEGDSAVTGFTPNGGSAQSVTLQTGSSPGFSHFFGLNDLFVTPGFESGETLSPGLTRAMTVREDLVTDPSRLSRAATAFTLPLTGGQNLIAAGDSTIAEAMAAKFDEPLSFSSIGGLGVTSTTLAGYGAEITFGNATAAARADSNVAIQGALHEELKFRSDSLSGVNLDEELSQMIVIQQAYSASARIVTTVQELFAVLQQMV